jgi:hypothetical protein
MALDNMPRLKQLDVSDCTQLSGCAVCFLESLEVLVMQNCARIGDGAFRKLSNLRTLNVLGCTSLTGALFKCLPNLEELVAVNCPRLLTPSTNYDYLKGLVMLVAWDEDVTPAKLGFALNTDQRLEIGTGSALAEWARTGELLRSAFGHGFSGGIAPQATTSCYFFGNGLKPTPEVITVD